MHLALKQFFVAAFVVFGVAANAHDDSMGRLKGDKLDLFYSDHAMSGQIADKLVFATPFETAFGMTLHHRSAGKTFTNEFEQKDKKLVGSIQSDSKGTEFSITKLDASKGLLEGKLGDDEFSIQVTSQTMAGHHYVNPNFDVKVAGKDYSFKLEDGQACMGCITKIAYVVLGMLRVTGTL